MDDTPERNKRLRVLAKRLQEYDRVCDNPAWLALKSAIRNPQSAIKNPLHPLEILSHAAALVMGAHSGHMLAKDLKGDVRNFGRQPKPKKTRRPTATAAG